MLIRQKGEWQPAEVVEGQRHGKSVIARLVGIDDREQAAALVGAEFGVLRDRLPEPRDGQFYWYDLEGLRVVNCDGTELGTIDYMLETGSNDVMVVKGEQERLIPFVRDKIVLDVDLVEKIVKVDWEWD